MSESDSPDDIGTSPDSLDLSPREPSARQRRQRRPWLAMIVLL